MTLLLDERVSRTLDIIVRDWATGSNRGARLDAWVFEDVAARKDAEARLAAAGVVAHIRSAYKPLVHAFLDEIALSDLTRVTVRYPVHPEALPLRFLSEAYPLAAMLDLVETVFEPGVADLTYRVRAEYRDGNVVEREVFAPNRLRGEPPRRSRPDTDRLAESVASHERRRRYRPSHRERARDRVSESHEGDRGARMARRRTLCGGDRH